MSYYVLVFILLLISSAHAQMQVPGCQRYFAENSDTPIVLCYYDFDKEDTLILMSKECISKTCEAYKAYEKAFTLDNSTRPGEMDHNPETWNCLHLGGVPVWLSESGDIYGDNRFCKFKDSSYVESYLLDSGLRIDPWSGNK